MANAIFIWEGKTKTGDARKGEMEAPDKEAVTEKLKQQNISVSKVVKKPRTFQFKLPGVGGVSSKDLVIFTRQFATMIDAGLPLVQCLDILANQTPNPEFKRILKAITGDVESGSTFADALSKHPRVFDDLYVNLVAAGEVSGILDTILQRLAVYIEKNLKLIKQVKGAMAYPIGILVVAVVVVIVLMVYVIPIFENMFKDFGGGSLPVPTQVVIAISQFFQKNILFILMGIGGLIAGWKAFYRSKAGRDLFDKVILKVPLIGGLITKIATAKFTRTMGTMVASGVPIIDALNIVAKTSGNHTIERALYGVRDAISEGKTMVQPLEESKIFPSMVVQMIGVGEATGALDVMLSKIADFYEDEVDTAVSAITSLMEPFMMVFLGGICGGLIIAMYLPIFSMAGNMKDE